MYGHRKLRHGMQQLAGCAAQISALRVLPGIAINNWFTRGASMTAEQSTKRPDISFVKDMRGQILYWIAAAGDALKPLKVRLRPLAVAIKKNAWVIFAVLLTAGVMEFSYYQARLTQDYLRVLLLNGAQINGDIDALDAKLNQLDIKIEALAAKIDKLPVSPAAIPAKPQPSIFSKPR